MGNHGKSENAMNDMTRARVIDNMGKRILNKVIKRRKDCSADHV